MRVSIKADRLTAKLFLFFGLIALCAIAVFQTGCVNTWEGVARDISGASHGIARTLNSNGAN